MRAGKLALQGIAIRAVTALSGSHDSGDDTALQVDFPDGMVLAIGNVHRLTVIGHDETFRAGQSSAAQRAEPRSEGGPAIAGIAVFAGTANPFDAILRSIEQKYAVTFPKSEKPSAVPRDLERSRPGQSASGKRTFVRSAAVFAVAGKRGDDSGLRIHAAQTVVERITYIKVVKS